MTIEERGQPCSDEPQRIKAEMHIDSKGEVKMEQKLVATCEYCDREMDGTECGYGHVVINGQEFSRIRLGDAKEKWEEMGLEEVACECVTPIGGIHHVHCDQEVCPRCGGQFLVCTMEGGDCEVEAFLCFSK
jgi:hypothetical protein